MTEDFAPRVLAWFERHGRHDLPWQKRPSAYRVWVSEIMLQQTRVGTVIPYFQRFMRSFPSLRALADAELDDVLHHWSGLGYYARARNLHAAAQAVVQRHGGRMPKDIDALQALPGIGRSTAGAILALAHGQRHAILDGNVKRVLTRFHALDGWPGAAPVMRELWALAETHTPNARVSEYTQAMMDLGATVCTRSQPDCPACPLRADCRALAQGRSGELPAPRPKRDLPTRRTAMLLLTKGDARVLLERRPASGIWGGLWSLPEMRGDAEPAEWILQAFGLQAREVEEWPVHRHGFTHFRLEITPLHVRVEGPAVAMDTEDRLWYNLRAPQALGLAAPVRRLLAQLESKDKEGGA